MRTRRLRPPSGILLILTLFAVGLAVSVTTPDASAAAKLRFHVTIKNLSKADLTPVVFGVHNRSAKLFRVGKPATPGIAELAKDGGTALAAQELRRQRGVRKKSVGVASRISPGGTVRFTIATTKRHLRLSWASMAVCSNDTFAGQSGLRLPAARVGAVKRINARAYDAGAERNSESARDVPCLGAHGVGPREMKAIRLSSGITGRADLSKAQHGWGRFIARVTVKRVA